MAILALVTSRSAIAQPAVATPTVARLWNEALLDAVRRDFPAPTVHARNLYHTSAAMYDAWAAYDSTAVGHFYKGKESTVNIQAARDEAISYAAYRLLSQRYAIGIDPTTSQIQFDYIMSSLGYDPNVTTTEGDSPAAVGNRIAERIITTSLSDGSNEANQYADSTGYTPINPPMVVDYPAVTDPMGPSLTDANHWQPLYIDSYSTQNDLPVGFNLQRYIGPHWGGVETFALGKGGNSAANSWAGIDPGAPPPFGSDEFRENTMQLIRFSNWLDPEEGAGAELINLSPRVSGNRPLGTHDDQGYVVNPATGQPYADNFVKRADYGRVLAEYWADGPQSETPPGHWNVIANLVSDNPAVIKRIGGAGPVVDDLEWDVKLQLALNGGMHDAAIAAWGVKRKYDYSRPITMIRYLASLGQASDSNAASYHPEGLFLEEGLVEVITAETIAVGGKHRNVYDNANRDSNGFIFENLSEEELVGQIAILAWNHEPLDPSSEVSGRDWILGENWVPFQQDNFVTPAFASYVSGHSTFSRVGAEVLAAFTGSEFFPGGLGEATFLMNDFLEFEQGPSETLTLQWATYFDAADEAGISRLWGGIHVPPDDFAGRIMGSAIGIDAVRYANSLFSPVPEPLSAILIIVGLCAAICDVRILRSRSNRIRSARRWSIERVA